MGARSRTRNTNSLIPGTRIIYLDSGSSSTSVGQSGVNGRETTDDVTMPRPYVTDHTFVSTKRLASAYRVTGTLPMSGLYDRIEYSQYNPGGSLWTNCPTMPSFNSTYWRTKALANLNPYAAKVDIPLFIWELQDLPRMLRDAGYLLSRKVSWKWKISDPGSAFLAYKFGWAALFTDLLGMLDFVKHTENRKAYLRALERGSHFQRRLFSGNTEGTLPTLITMSNPIDGTPDAQWYQWTETHEQIWFTANAKLKDPLPANDEALQALASRLVLGMDAPQLERLWDFIPWTWLIDYFVNVGDYLEAWATLTRLEITRMNLMATRRRTVTRRVAFVKGGLSATPGFAQTCEKRRIPYANPTPGIFFTPFLTGGQVAILGALASTRTKRALR